MKKLVIITLLLMYSLTSIGQIKSTRNTTETDRNFVVLEIGTGTWCSLCQGAAMGVEDMIQEGLDVAVIEYHYDDDYANTASNSRLIDYYDVPGYPSSFFDGVLPFYGGYNDISLYFQYLPLYEERINIPSPFELVTNIQPTGDDNFNVSVTVTDLDNYQGTDLKLHVVLTESNIPEAWQNQTELDYVCRDMIPDQYGTSLDFSSQNTQLVDLEINIPYELANCEIVTFVQNNGTKEILQATKTCMITTGMEEMSSFDNKLKLYPNPFNDFTSLSYYLEKEIQIKIAIRDLSGRIVTNLLDEKQLAGEHTLKWDAKDSMGNLVNRGIYFCTFTMRYKATTIKLIVQ
ncbi:MAG: hypothetical protein DRJ05_11960 [Bacteroidetes bacterium]|nr:MAG: hypothetical protein DRJ05_11960 [Bacteroidota bacterium]